MKLKVTCAAIDFMYITFKHGQNINKSNYQNEKLPCWLYCTTRNVYVYKILQISEMNYFAIYFCGFVTKYVGCQPESQL